jgi:hypothetical protein
MPRSPSLYDPQVAELIWNYVRPLLPGARSAFPEKVDELLRGEPEIGVGVVSRACREAQRMFVSQSSVRDHDSSVLPRMSALMAAMVAPVEASRT